MATKDRPTRNSATDHRELVTVARQVIDANRYLVLATADQHAVPTCGEQAVAPCRRAMRVSPKGPAAESGRARE
jgi:hypothetical protein